MISSSPLRLGLLGISFLFLAWTTLPASQAADCPALRITDIPSHLQGQEILSNTAPLEFAVRLTWENPTEFKPVRTHVYRRSKDTSFTKIGQTSSGTATVYIDKTITKTSPAYIYAVQSEFTCGGTLWSEPVTITTPRRTMDTTAPLIQIITPRAPTSLRGADDIFIYVRDSESGVAEKTVQIKAGNTTIPAGNNLGTTQYALFRLPATSIPTKETTLKVTVSNGADLKAERSLQVLKADATTTAPTWSSPTAGAGVDPRLPLTLSWNLGSLGITEKSLIQLSYSTNFGTDWFPLEDKELTTTTLTPNDLLKGIKNAGVVWLRLTLEGDPTGKTHGAKILPLFMPLTTVTMVAPGNFLATPTGTLTFQDALKGTKITFAEDTPSRDSEDTTKLSLTDRQVTLALRPGFYGIEEFMDSFLIAPSTQGKVLQISPGDTTLSLEAYPYAFFLSDRAPLSSEGEAILSNTFFPRAFAEAYAAYDKKMAIATTTTPAQVPTEPAPTPLLVRLIRCSTSACTSTPYAGTSPQTLLWDKETGTFQNATGSGQVITPSPIYFGKITLDTAPLGLHIPDMYFDTFSWTADESFTASSLEDGGVTWQFPERFIRSLQAMTGFVKVSYALPPGRSCTEYLFERTDALGNKAIVPTLCATNMIVGVLLPFTKTDIRAQLRTRDFAVLEGDAWYVPYMNQFQLWNMLVQESDITRPHDLITRGELAYLLHKAFQYPVGSYTGGKETFSDLPGTHPFAPYLLGLVSYNIMSGDASLPQIRPDNPVNRAEALKMILIAAHLSSTQLSPRLATQSVPSFIDAPKDAWFTGYITRAAQLGIVSGYFEGGKHLFKPENPVSRAEAVKLLYASLEKKALE